MKFTQETEKILHIRRCHICNHVTENDKQHIEKCEGCGKSLAPFFFCMDPGVEELTSDFRTDRDKKPQTSSFLRSEFPPIYGISLYWS